MGKRIFINFFIHYSVPYLCLISTRVHHLSLIYLFLSLTLTTLYTRSIELKGGFIGEAMLPMYTPHTLAQRESHEEARHVHVVRV